VWVDDLIVCSIAGPSLRRRGEKHTFIFGLQPKKTCKGGGSLPALEGYLPRSAHHFERERLVRWVMIVSNTPRLAMMGVGVSARCLNPRLQCLYPHARPLRTFGKRAAGRFRFTASGRLAKHNTGIVVGAYAPTPLARRSPLDPPRRAARRWRAQPAAAKTLLVRLE
jgi:hypothetical protein